MIRQTRYNQRLFLMTLSVYMGLVLASGVAVANAQSETAAEPQAEKAAVCNSIELGNTALSKFFKLGYHGGNISYLPQSMEYAFDDEDLVEMFDLEIALTFSDFNYPKYSVTHGTRRLFGEGRDAYPEDLIANAMKLAGQFAFRVDTEKRVSSVPVTVKILSDEKAFFVKVTFAEHDAGRAAQFADAYRYFIEEDACGDLSIEDMDDLLSANTEVHAEGNRVVIVSQTSRTAIDKMFAIRKKARGENE